MKDDLRITELHGPRFDLAIEQALLGAAFNFDRCSINLAGDIVDCAITSRFTPSNIPDEVAWNDIKHAKQVFAHLCSASNTFARVVNGKPVQYSIICDYGTGCVLLGRLVDGSLEWAKGIDRP